MNFKYSKSIYPKTVLIKAAYSFTDRAYIHLDDDEDSFIVSIEYKEDQSFNLSDFENEMLAQLARYEIYKQTNEIRKITVARALATTVIDETSNDVDDNEQFDSKAILTDWFDNYE